MDALSSRRRAHTRCSQIACLTLGLGLALACATQPAHADRARQSRPAGSIDGVVLKIPAELRVLQESTEALTVEAEPNVLARIVTTVSGGTLTIDTAGGFTTREPVLIVLRVKRLSAIENRASGEIHAASLATDRMRLVTAGSGALRIDALTAAALTVDASGAGTIAIDSGGVEQATIRVSGSAEYTAPMLRTRDARVDADGSAQAVVAATKSLAITARGSARVVYRGDAAVTEKVEGAASVERN